MELGTGRLVAARRSPVSAIGLEKTREWRGGGGWVGHTPLPRLVSFGHDARFLSLSCGIPEAGWHLDCGRLHGVIMTPRALIVAMLLIAAPASTLADSCFESSITSPTPFMGNHGEVFRLADGSIWEVQHEYEYLYEYSPSVVVCPLRGKLLVDGKTLDVRRLSSSASPSPGRESTGELIESQIDGEFSGWDGDTIFKLTNGQIWQQSSYAYTYSYKSRPSVIIFRSHSGYEMQVDGVDGRVRVTRLK